MPKQIGKPASGLPMSDVEAIPQIDISLGRKSRARHGKQRHLVGNVLISFSLAANARRSALFIFKQALKLVVNVSPVANLRDSQHALQQLGHKNGMLMRHDVAHLVRQHPS
jgi:hypothetical protein